MTDKHLPNIYSAILLLIISTFAAACSLPSDSPSDRGAFSDLAEINSGTHPIDPIFREFYAYLGGVDVLGPGISPLHEVDGLKRQYVENGLMIYDFQATRSDQYRLAALGREFEVADPPVPEPQDPALRHIAGHIIHPDFLPIYESLGGARFVGRPLTEARHNQAKMRIEQYFENLGFYRLITDPSGQAHLMAYGVLACDRICRYQPSVAAIPEKHPPLPEPFAAIQSRLGLSFVGLTLSEPYRAPDGKLEVIFENIVLAAESEDAPDAFARPIVQMVGIPRQEMSECKNEALVVCLPGRQNRGYSVPIYFQEYIYQHGGWDLFGMPVTEVYLVQADTFRQCYTNLCLDFVLNDPSEVRLRPLALGKVYKDLYYDSLRKGEFEEDFQGVRLHVWENQPLVASSQPQVIQLQITENELPLANREPILTVTFPDNTRETYNFPPTNQYGATELEIPPIGAPNGTLIPYEVCLTGLQAKTFCVGENYLIWNYP